MKTRKKNGCLRVNGARSWPSLAPSARDLGCDFRKTGEEEEEEEEKEEGCWGSFVMKEKKKKK